MDYIEPLDLQTIFVNLFAGDASYFAPMAIFAILILAGYFKMSVLTVGFLVFVFLVMFSGFMPPTLLLMVAIIGGLAVGFVLSKLVKN